MEESMIAYCGLVCTDCDAYKATQAGDTDALERMAEEAADRFGVEMTVADAMCDGCRAATGRQIEYCHECAIRLCAVQKHIENCAYCEDYPCEKIDGFSKPGSAHRRRLDDMRASLRPAS